MHANKGSRKLQSSGHSVVKTVTKPTSDESEQKYEGEKSSVKKAGRMRKDVGSLHRSGIHVKRVLSGKISRRSLNGFVSKSVRNSGQHRLGHRPRRNVIHRTWDYTAGLSWKEEKELKKALMASLQESKKSNKQSNEHNSESSNSNADVMQNKGERKQKMLKLQIPQPREASNQTESSTKNTNLNYQVQVRAQRKFAQGSRPCSPGCSPLKGRSLHSKALVTKKAKTEDFLTFLCLRGTTTLPPHLDFSNNFMECESLSSFPNTPRHSQDGSRPETPVTAGSNHGNNSRGTDDTSRSGSPDVEIALESADLGVKPLVGASGRAAMVTGGVGSATSTRACTYLTNRCATATRCTTNAMSFSDSNSSFSTSTATSSSASTPSPVDCSLGGTTGLNPHGTDYASVSANSRHQYHMAAEDVRTDVVCRRYITRGKQKSIQESIAAKGHCSSLGSKCAKKANEVNDFSNRRISPRGAERVDKLLLKKMVPKVKDKTREPKDCKRSCGQRHRLAGCETCMYAFPEESRHEKHVLKKQSKSRTKGKAPTIARPFKGSRKEASSKSSYYVTRMGSGEKAHSRPCAQTRRVIAAESQQEDEEDEDGCNDDDDNNDGGHDDGDEGISESLNFRVDIATQTSDTSSYTAEIDIDFLLDDNSDTDVSEDEVSSDDKLDVDDACETEQVEMSSTGPKEDCKEGSSPDTTQNIATSYTAETYQGTPVVSQDLVSMETSTATSEPIVSFTGCPISAMRPFSQSQPITVNYSEPVSTTTNVAQPAMITYSGNTFPLQTCTMVGQNLILDENARSMLLNDAPTQVVNNMSIQMQGFSVQQGLSTLPVDNISGLSYIHPALNVGTGPSQSLLPNTIATIDNPLATSPVAVVPNQGLALQGSQSLQVNLSNVAIGTRCASGKPELSTSMPVHLCPARSLANILPKILPGPSSTPMGTMFTKCVTSALSPAPVTHLAASITCAAAVKLLDVHATGSVSLPPLVAPVVSCAGSVSLPPRVAPVVSCASPSAAFRAVSSRFLLAAQRPISALCPLPPPVMAPGFYQVHLGIACTSVVL